VVQLSDITALLYNSTISHSAEHIIHYKEQTQPTTGAQIPNLLLKDKTVTDAHISV
jgi:hypothetical protein